MDVGIRRSLTLKTVKYKGTEGHARKIAPGKFPEIVVHYLPSSQLSCVCRSRLNEGCGALRGGFLLREDFTLQLYLPFPPDGSTP